MGVIDDRSAFGTAPPAWKGGASNTQASATVDHYASRPGNVSQDGRKITYSVYSTRPGAWHEDCYVHDRDSGTSVNVSVGPDGKPIDGCAFGPEISPEGRFVVFDTDSPQIAKSGRDVFIRDLERGTTELVSAEPPHPDALFYGAHVAAGGNLVSYTYEFATPEVERRRPEIHLRDLVAGTTRRVDVSTGGAGANAPSFGGSMSADGRLVAFSSRADNLVDGDTNGASDVFVHDTRSGQTVRASVGTEGQQANGPSYGGRLSSDGRYLAFVSKATNLSALDTGGHAHVYRRDLQTGETMLVGRTPSGLAWQADCGDAAIAGDGRYVAWSVEESAGRSALYVVDCDDGAIVRVSPEDGTSKPAALSENGGFLLFGSTADSLPKGAPTHAEGLEEVYGTELVRVQGADGTVLVHDDSVVIGGVRIPKRHASSQPSAVSRSSADVLR